MRDRPDYGIDAPRALLGYVLLGVALLALGIAFTLSDEAGFGARLLRQGVWMGPVLLAGGAFHLWSSKVGKVREAVRLLDGLAWRGDENVLDVGCGRGLLLVEAARRVPRGRAVGIDIWSPKDQSGNRPEATRRNAVLAGVDDRVAVADGDARRIPFADGSFDVVLSSAVIHNIHDRAGRARALREMVRVLRAGGRLAVIDILHVREYGRELRSLGFEGVAVSPPRPLWLFAARTVTATKRDGPAQ